MIFWVFLKMGYTSKTTNGDYSRDGIRSLFSDEPNPLTCFFSFCMAVLQYTNLQPRIQTVTTWLTGVIQGLFFFAAGQPGTKWCAELFCCNLNMVFTVHSSKV